MNQGGFDMADRKRESMAKFETSKLADALGAEIRGLDLSHPLDGDTVAALRAAWLRHLVLVFRDQDLNVDALRAR